MSDPLREPLARRIEEFGLNLMHTRRQLLYDGWLVFLLAGKAKRGRSVNAHFASTLPLDRKIAHCEALYARHGLPPLFRITPFSQPGELDAALDARGFVRFDPTHVQVAALDSPTERCGNDAVALEFPLIQSFVESVGDLRGSPASQRDAHLERLSQIPLDVLPIVARKDDAVAAAGLLAVDGSVAGIFDVVTADAWAGHGIGTALVSTLAARAWERSAKHVFVQVTADNAPALALYRKLGFTTLYSYHYRGRPGACE